MSEHNRGFVLEEPQDNITQDNGFELISQGAEARVFKGVFLGKDVIVKERFSKAYRHPVLDQKITSRRVGSEAKILVKCKSQLGKQPLFDVPAVYFVDPYRFHRIYMERVNGITVKRFLLNQFLRFQRIQKADQGSAMTDNNNNNDDDDDDDDGDDALPTGDEDEEFDEELFMGDAAQVDCYNAAAFDLMHNIGQSIAVLHNNQIIHGDLTTSNMLLRDGDPSKLVMIDFGLSYTSHLEEDKAVDLYVLERALISTHPYSQKLFEKLLEGYGNKNKKGKIVVDRLHQVRQRGRKRTMVG